MQAGPLGLPADRLSYRLHYRNRVIAGSGRFNDALQQFRMSETVRTGGLGEFSFLFQVGIWVHLDDEELPRVGFLSAGGFLAQSQVYARVVAELEGLEGGVLKMSREALSSKGGTAMAGSRRLGGWKPNRQVNSSASRPVTVPGSSGAAPWPAARSGGCAPW